MIICGIKLTHDGSIALIDDGKLVFSYEIEKINNNPRHSTFNLGQEEIDDILKEYGYSWEQVDSLVFDGWNNEYVHIIGNRAADSIHLPLHGYDPLTNNSDLLDVKTFNLESFPQYNSYQHVSGHALGAYCSSPFSKELQSSFILVWDGAIGPQLYYFDAEKLSFNNLGWVHFMYGSSYGQFANRYYPFNQLDSNDMSIPGKVMAYIANGRVDNNILAECHSIYLNLTASLPNFINNTFCRHISRSFQEALFKYGEKLQVSGDDMMTTFHHFLGELLVQNLKKKVSQFPDFSKNLCFAGGSALNIKWNSTLRSSGLFSKMWIPPFPNDSGSALGAACCEMVKKTGTYFLEWKTYSGPQIKMRKFKLPRGWEMKSCSIEELAYLLHNSQQPVVVLTGRAELGPRALGHRSILAPANTKWMKKLLNIIKDREDYRPVAPICLEEDAALIFEPGSSDPLMLYDHFIKKNWRDRIPAVMHLDGSARLQTVNSLENAEIYHLLTVYKKLSGIPLLCNTSANLKGKGFFPDVKSAIEWNGCSYVWSGNKLWYTNSKNAEEGGDK